jgi:5'-phosphate synthase pdxT subunit
VVVGLLGIQGAFMDHIPHFARLGVECTIVRDHESLNKVDRLVIPGGESTVMGKFLVQYGLVSTVAARIAAGMPIWGICAGAILLARVSDGAPGIVRALPISVVRNAYGRQLQSRQKAFKIPDLGIESYSAIFIRAPKIIQVDQNVTVLARCGKDPVFVQKKRIMATTFHPELNQDDLVHSYFLSI